MSELFRIKICGITNQADATVAVNAGADAIGLNFYTTSLRSITAEEAANIETPDSVGRVGIFVNHGVKEVIRIAETAKLDFVQLHGDETPEEFANFRRPIPLIPVIRIKSGADAATVIDAIKKWSDQDGLDIAAILLDAQVGKAYGGTGHQLDWKLAAAIVEASPLPVILAGGLNAENVSQAIEQVRPYGVDVASGVEALPGKKDPAQVRQFVANAAQ